MLLDAMVVEVGALGLDLRRLQMVRLDETICGRSSCRWDSIGDR